MYSKPGSNKEKRKALIYEWEKKDNDKFRRMKGKIGGSIHAFQVLEI
jgi:hypothetical protein